MSKFHITENNQDMIDFTVNSINSNYASNKYSRKALKALKDKIIEYLSGEERKLLYMIYIDSLSVEQIADKLNFTQNNVHKKIRKLKKDIKQIGDALVLYDLSVLTADEKIVYEQYFCYRKSIQSIAIMLGKDRRIISNEIKIIKTKLNDNLSQSGQNTEKTLKSKKI